MVMKTVASNKGWHNQWFYVKNYSNSLLPGFTGRTIDVAPEVWSYGLVKKEKKRILDLLQAIEQLKRRGLTGAGVIGAYHARQVAPLMLRARSLADMTPGASTEGTVLATGALAASEIRQRIREALEDKDADYPGMLTRVVDSHPPMPEDADRRLQNRLLAEEQKCRKDKETAKKKRKAAKELKRRRRGRVVSDDEDDNDDDDEEEDKDDDEEEEELALSPRSGALVIREARPQTAVRDEAEGSSARGSAPQGSGAMPQGLARGASQEPAWGAPQESARSAPRRSSEPAPAIAQEPARGTPQESAQSTPRRSTEPVPAVAQEPARGTPQESARSAPRRSTEPVPTVAQEPMWGAHQESARSAPRRSMKPAPLGPKKVLRVSSTSSGRTAAPHEPSGGVPGEVADPAVGAAPVTATGAVAWERARTPFRLLPLRLTLRCRASFPGPSGQEVIDLDADKAEGTAATGTGTDVLAAAMGTVAVTEEGVSASAAEAEEAAVTEVGTSAPEVPAEVAPAAEAEVPARGAPAGAEEPTSAVAVEGEVAAGILVPPPASEAVEPSSGSAAALIATGAQAPGPLVNSEASGSTPALALATSVPKAWRGSVLHWTSREDPSRHLFTLDDAAEWRKWQAVQGSLANARVALPSVLGELDNVVLPGSQALQECSRGKSDFLRLERGLWERFNLEREQTRELSTQVAATQGPINDLQRREQVAQEDVRRSEAKFEAVVDKACRNREELQATAAEKSRLDAEELGRQREDLDALQKTVERIRRERQKAWQEWDSEAAQKNEAEKMAAELGAKGADRERELKARSDEEIARLRELLDTERGEHGALRDAVRIVCDGLGVVQGEGSSSLTAHVLGMYHRACKIAVDALHTGVRRAFGVFGSHYLGINFAGMSGGYATGYSEAELDEIDASVFNPAEALAKLLEDEAVPPEDPPAI
uniref:Uncharacterized protein n=1 Tax=Setaria viridis TaxID=4556 RepID=A0A4U6TFV5_SETVI|nr:hypothetical protein SEVIR_8G159000v2 [Setaria viridis]